MSNQLDTGKIANLLTQSSRQLDAETTSALADVRRQALKNQRVRTQEAVLSSGRGTHDLVSHSGHNWLFFGIVAAIFVFAVGYWQHFQEQQHQEQHISSIDVAILTDDLPLEVFVD